MDENLKITKIYRMAFRNDGERLRPNAFAINAIIIITLLSLFHNRLLPSFFSKESFASHNFRNLIDELVQIALAMWSVRWSLMDRSELFLTATASS